MDAFSLFGGEAENCMTDKKGSWIGRQSFLADAILQLPTSRACQLHFFAVQRQNNRLNTIFSLPGDLVSHY
jgi:hypothetical protein